MEQLIGFDLMAEGATSLMTYKRINHQFSLKIARILCVASLCLKIVVSLRCVKKTFKN